MSTPPDAPTALTIHGLALPDSHRPKHGFSDRIAGLAAQAVSSLLGVVKPGQTIPLPHPPIFSPHYDSLRFGSTHFGITIPDLPEPHCFMAFSAILGMLGVKVMDTDHATTRDGPRHTAVVAHGTAAASTKAFSAYSMKTEMKMQADGSSIHFGKDIELSGTYPNFHLRSHRHDLSVNLDLTATGDTSWFAQSFYYEHLSLLVRYNGVIEQHGTAIPVSGLGTWEYWRAASPYLPGNPLLSVDHKRDGDFLTYNVINLDTDSQLLLIYVALMDYPITCMAYIRSAGQGSILLDADVRFQVLTAQSEPATAPDGRQMTLPETFRWTVNGRREHVHFVITGTIDTPMMYGMAAGYAGGFHWTGSQNGAPRTGRGYLSYVDQRH